MRKFFSNLINAEDPTSSRRFAALIGLLLFTATVITSIAGVDIHNEVLYATGGLTTLCLGLTILRK